MKAAEGAELVWGGQNALRLALKSGGVLSLALSEVEGLSKGGAHEV